MYFLTSYRNRLSTGGERWRERGGSIFRFLVCIVSYPKLTAKVNQTCLLSGRVHHLWSAWEDTGVNGNIHRYCLQLTAYVGLCLASYLFLLSIWEELPPVHSDTVVDLEGSNRMIYAASEMN